MKLDLDITSKKVIFTASGLTIITAGLLIYFFVFTGPAPETPTDELAVCLAENDVTMYSLPTCPHCQEQKDKFGDSFQYINHVNCSENRDECIDQGIESVPTWVIDGEKFIGVQELGELAEKTSCEYAP